MTTIDDVLMTHNDFLDKCLRDCMLSNREVLKIMSRMMAVCVTFTNHMQKVVQQLEVQSLQESAPSARGRLRARLLSVDLEEIVSSESFEQTITNFDKNFTRDLVELLDMLYSMNNDTVSSMVGRLDFNGYYQERVRTQS